MKHLPHLICHNHTNSLNCRILLSFKGIYDFEMAVNAGSLGHNLIHKLVNNIFKCIMVSQIGIE